MLKFERKDPEFDAITRRLWKTRPRKAGTLIARNMIIRALRCAGLSHVLKGQPAAVGLLYPPSFPVQWLVEAGEALLRHATQKQQLCLEFSHERRQRKLKDPKGTDLTNWLSESHVIFGFATEMAHFPDVFRLAADRIISLGSVDGRAIDAAFRAILGTIATDDVIETTLQLAPNLLGAVLRPGRTPKDIADIIRRQASPDSQGPTLPSLHVYSGFGEAAAWGKALAKDLADYAAGRLSWSEIDRGALISGPSGTGKTLFAQVLAQTCGIPLFAHSLARWQARGHLGDLLAAMNAAFDQAIENAPCIIFLDECDAFGSRDRFSGDNEQYSREVVNGLLERLDGIAKREGVVVIGATNMPEKLDPALLRPGRLGRHLKIFLPDADERNGILRHHLGADLKDEDLSDAIACLDGATGAVIEQVIRDARRRARTECRPIAITDITAALPPRIRLSDAAFVRACVHEAGHALVGRRLEDISGNIVLETKVSREFLVGRTGGQTSFHRHLGFDRTRAAYIADITTLLAGLAAEAVILGEYADGGGGSTDSDLYQATLLATQMEISLGLGLTLACTTSPEPDQLIKRLDDDPALRRTVDTILVECMSGAKAMLEKDRRSLERIAYELAASIGFDRNSFSATVKQIAGSSALLTHPYFQPDSSDD